MKRIISFVIINIRNDKNVLLDERLIEGAAGKMFFVIHVP